MKLLIRNLARSTTEAALRAMFEAHGKVQSCTLIIDKESGNSKGFGFVEMPKQGDAKAAMKTLNGKEVDGYKIRVKKAESKPVTWNNQSVRANDKIK
jgi:RNA recognition motif-containing protein